MDVNYIYNAQGQPEYAVIPYLIWKKLQIDKKINFNILSNDTHKKFNPADYKGILCDLNLDTEAEISDLRKQWKRNI
jgi:hypothetical protein